jgi:hypothetical protein
MNHTKAPWRWEFIGTMGNDQLVSGSAEDGTFEFVGTKDDKVLQAAAPDLLAACQEIIDGMVDGKNSTNKNVTMYAIQMVKSAIAKATAQ